MPNGRHVRSSLLHGLFAALLIHAPGAAAEVRVTKAPSGKLVVEAHDATVQDVLDAMSASQALELHSSAILSRAITGTYSGTLEHVLARVLDGYDRVIRSTASGVRIDVVKPDAVANTATRPAPAMQPGPPNLRPLPVQHHPPQPRIVRGFLDQDGELQ